MEKNNNRIEGVIFDLDGLLLDTERIVKRTWTDVGAKMGYPDMGEQIYHTIGFNRARRKVYFQSVYGKDFPHDEIVEMTVERFDEIAREEGIPVKPGASELLAFLKAKGLKIGLATSSSQEHAIAELKNAGLWGYFDGCIFGGMVSRSKPDKEVYEKACVAIGVEPQYALALEDAPSGIQSAYGAGVRVIMIPDLVQPTEAIRQLTWDVKPTLNDVIPVIERYSRPIHLSLR